MQDNLPKSIKDNIKLEFELRSSNNEKFVGVGYPCFDENELYSAIDCLLDLRISQGSRTNLFENEFSNYIGTKYGVATNSGSSANLLALSTLIEAGDIQVGDEVIVPAATFATVSAPIYQLGLIPVYVDVNVETLCIDTSLITSAISDKTKLIMPVPTLGFLPNMNSIMNIAKENKLFILEDCCEAHGSEFEGKKVGSFGDLSTFSFFVAHNITTGEGGMIMSSNEKYEQILRSKREFGRIQSNQERYLSIGKLIDYDTRYIFSMLGYNFRMTDIAASLGLVQLKKLDEINQSRITNAKFYDNMLKNFGNYFSSYKDNVNYVTYYGYPILIKESAPFSRLELCLFLEKNSIETRPMMAGCLPDQPGYENLNHRISGDLSVSRLIRDQVFFIGCHPHISKEDLDYVESVFTNFLNKNT